MDHPSTTEHDPRILTASVAGPLIFEFPVRMFENPTTHAVTRSRFIREMVALWDAKAEECRVYLNNIDGKNRPALPKLGLAIIDTSAVEKAAEPNDIEGAPA